MIVEQVLETCLYAENLEAVEDFYRRVLGLEFFARVPGRHAFFRCGRSMVLFFNPTATEVPHAEIDVPCHGGHGPGHVCFTMKKEDIDRWRQHLQSEKVPIEKELAWPNGGFSFYFRDPAGNSVELATPSLWSIATEAQSTEDPNP